MAILPILRAKGERRMKRVGDALFRWTIGILMLLIAYHIGAIGDFTAFVFFVQFLFAVIVRGIGDE